LEQIKNKVWDSKELLSHVLDQELFVSKYSIYLPKEMQQKMHFAHKIDIHETLAYLNQFQFSLIKID